MQQLNNTVLQYRVPLQHRASLVFLSAAGVAHIFKLRGLPYLVCGHHKWCRGIGAKVSRMERASRGFRAGAVHHHNKAQHALGKISHEIETLLSGVPNRYRTRSSSMMRPKSIATVVADLTNVLHRRISCVPWRQHQFH